MCRQTSFDAIWDLGFNNKDNHDDDDDDNNNDDDDDDDDDWMAWCKTDVSDFFGWNLFLQKCLNFCMCFSI